MLQWNEVLLTSDTLVNTIQSDYLKKEISRKIMVNGEMKDWQEVGITQNTSTGVLDFTEVGGFSGRLIFEYKASASIGSGVTNQTNGYDIDATLPNLRRLGWINPTDADYDIVNNDNQTSLCNRWYNDDSFHPLCRIDYLYDCQPDKSISYADFNTYLGRLTDSNISSMLNYVFDNPQFKESGLLYDKMRNTEFETVANSGKFVGIRFNLSKRDYFLNLVTAALLFDSAKTFTVYLFNEFTGKVAEWEVTTSANKQVIVDLSEALRYNDNVTKGGDWFLGYFQDDLGDTKAIRYPACWNNTFSFGAMCMASNVTGSEAFNMQTYEETYDTYGINIEYSVTEDLTQLIRRNAYLFDNLQGLMMAATVMEIIYTTSRSNRTQRITDEIQSMAFSGLNNVTTKENPTEPGLKSKIRKEIARVKKAFFNHPPVQVVSLR